MKTIALAALAALFLTTACGGKEDMPVDTQPLAGDWSYERDDGKGGAWYGWATVTLAADGTPYLSYADISHNVLAPDVLWSNGGLKMMVDDAPNSISWVDRGANLKDAGFSGTWTPMTIDAQQTAPAGAVTWRLYRP